MLPLGQTRTIVQRNHAFIAPDSHVQAPLPGWRATQGIILISPQMGARFTQFFALMEAGALAGAPLPEVERFVYVLDGAVTFTAHGESTKLESGHYAYIPADHRHRIESEEGGKLVVFERPYMPLARVDPPQVLVGKSADVTPTPFMGDEDAQLRILLPEEPSFDMGVNLFTFERGAALPFVETHVMEHGMLLTEGQGIYRLDDQWYPIQAGDVLWMGPYCPQWFAAIGKTQSAYLYYKDVHRDPLALEGK